MNTNDKRYIKNEKLIRETFMQMLLEKRYAEITVNELCERAFISKNAFYYHHENMDELLKTIMNELIDDMIKLSGDSIYFMTSLNEDEEPFDFKATFDYFEKRADLFYPFFLRDDEIGFSSRMVFAFKKTMFSKINPYKKNNFNIVILTDYVLFGSLSFVKSWFLNREHIDKKEAMDLFKSVHIFSAKKLSKMGREAYLDN